MSAGWLPLAAAEIQLRQSGTGLSHSWTDICSYRLVIVAAKLNYVRIIPPGADVALCAVVQGRLGQHHVRRPGCHGCGPAGEERQSRTQRGGERVCEGLKSENQGDERLIQRVNISL